LRSPIIAAIDIGTNSFHLLVAIIDKNNNLKTLYKVKEIMRLTSEYGPKEKIISKNEFKKSIKILKNYKKIADKYKAKIFAMATSAVREAKNKKEYIKKVKQKTGIKINAITGKKEAGYIYKGMQTGLPLKNKKVICVDIGGGSTEILLGKNGKTIFAASVKVGAVRITGKFFPDYHLNKKSINKCRDFVEKKIKSKKEFDFQTDYSLAVGASGTIHATASMIHYNKHKKPLTKPNGYSFTKEEFNKIFDKVLNKKTPLERLGIKGLEAKRTDIIPAGLIILSTVFELFKIEKIILSENALRSGIVYDCTIKMNNK